MPWKNNSNQDPNKNKNNGGPNDKIGNINTNEPG